MPLVTSLHHYYNPTHLLEVIEDMRRLGPPMIRAHYHAPIDAWLAVEGTHRLRAALALGVVPIMIPVPWRKTAKALERARFAHYQRAHGFARVAIAGEWGVSFKRDARSPSIALGMRVTSIDSAARVFASWTQEYHSVTFENLGEHHE